LDLSSITFIRNISQTDTRGDVAKAGNPLQVGSRTILPDLAPVLNQATEKNLSFYLVAYVDTSGNMAPSLAMELSQSGVALTGMKIDLGKPDDLGRIQYIGTIAAGALSPGDYSVRFVLQQGTQDAPEAAFFTVR
jgi:hypothetical protein